MCEVSVGLLREKPHAYCTEGLNDSVELLGMLVRRRPFLSDNNDERKLVNLG